MKNKELTTVHMGLNTSPYDKEHWQEKLDEVKRVVESEGAARASWGCTGRTLHLYLANQLKEALPEYEFNIEYERYLCEIRRRR